MEAMGSLLVTLYLYRLMVASWGRLDRISTLNLFSWNMARASSRLTTARWKDWFSFTTYVEVQEDVATSPRV